MNELGIVVAMSIAAILWAAMTYSVGYKEGQRAGYARGRAISRLDVAVKRDIYSTPVDVKEVK
ncbi:hypothetical protein UFOVP362_10 [uncultured Caudovirales phage]|uniref:Uncharacterized protein n=1 Tax=uncultured Caudovirales phage TaxID=2100421 RepID=A0A6J7WZ34_9CAUD|nr:hypothetical protein UFOVP362_10 [uncultured Caudovirales phage]